MLAVQHTALCTTVTKSVIMLMNKLVSCKVDIFFECIALNFFAR